MLLRRMCKAIGAGGRLVIDGIWRLLQQDRYLPRIYLLTPAIVRRI